MAQVVVTRLRVDNVIKYEGAESVKLVAVYSNDPKSPNYSFSKATPTASFELCITNKEIFGHFVPGKVYDIEISEYSPAVTSAA